MFKHMLGAAAAGFCCLLYSAPASAGFVTIEQFNIFNIQFNGNYNFTLPSNTGNPSQDNSVRILFTETRYTSRLVISGGDFDDDRAFTGTFTGDFWTTTFNVSEQAGLVNDAITVGGTYFHNFEPDPVRGGAGAVYTWGNNGQGGGFTLDADELTEVNDVLSGRVSETVPLLHTGRGEHDDTYTASLSAGGTNTLVFDDITSYQFVLDAIHDLPEPSSLSLSALGLLGLLAPRWLRTLVRRSP